ncbi:regulator of G-protein signaling protein-like isoform X2 [Scyliorhinus canicula]|uniref:regulator of G-protein signaling protein-like isoform X2 n=1 Tax=Scyliorhinus canicula TaxID=7830 RepID=UPI0018F4E669|nr:regulator of G-protein signaling protein-like isoform X2 [Scyliorhinus canicula]
MVKLHERVFEKLKTYWLPRFLTHCQYSLKSVKVCSPILNEYQAQVSQKEITKSHGRLKMSIKQTEGVTLPYFTKASKRLFWNLPYCKGKTTMKRPKHSGILKTKEEQKCPWSQSKAGRAPKPPLSSLPESSTLGCLSSYSRWACCSSAAKDKWSADTAHIPDEYIFPQTDSSIPLIKAPSMLTCWRSSEMPQQSQYLHWAFNADQLAGEPFAAFLRVNDYLSKLNYLHLWHEMNNFFRVVLSTKDRAGYHLRTILAEKIIDLYLKEGSKHHAQLQAETARNLKLVLPSGSVLPWIFTAQREIFEILRVMYDEFLDKEDEKFLNLVAGAQPNDPNNWTQCERRAPSDTETYDLHLRRMARSLILAQACSVLGDTETLTEEDWKMLAQEDIAYLGSMQILIEPAPKDIDFNALSFEELALRFPKLAIEEISKYFMKFYKLLVLLGLLDRDAIRDKLWTKLNLKYIKFGNQIVTRPKATPKNLTDVLTNPIAILFFERFLEAYGAEAPLNFWQTVEDLHNLRTEKERLRSIKWILSSFFNPNINPEVLFDCDAPSIRQIMDAVENGTQVSMNLLLVAQSEVQTCLDQNWFDMYLKTYPAEPIILSTSPPTVRSMQLISRTNRSWRVLEALIKSIISFRRMMWNPRLRLLFINYLRDEVYNSDQNTSTSRTMTRLPSQGSSLMLRGIEYGDDSDMPHLKKRMMFNRLVIINYLVNDLHFCMEIEQYVKRSKAGTLMAQAGVHDEIYEGLLRAKVEMIIKLFLQADTLPRLRVNITEFEKDKIIMSSRHGKLDLGLFHQPRMNVFLPLIYLWKRFCVVNALRIYGRPRPLWKKDYIPPNYFYPSVHQAFHGLVPSFSAEEFPTLRFTLAKGIQVLMPLEKDENPSPGEDSSEPFSSSGIKFVSSERQAGSSLGPGVPNRRQSSKLTVQKEGKKRKDSVA